MMEGPGEYERVWRVKGGKVTAPDSLDAKADDALPAMAQIIVLTAKDAAILMSRKKSDGTNSEAPSDEECDSNGSV